MIYKDNIEKYLNVIDGKTFIKNATIDGNTETLFVNFYGSFIEYQEENPESLVTEQDYYTYFLRANTIEKVFVIGSAMILRDFKELNTVAFTLEFDGEKYSTNINRDNLNEYIGFDISLEKLWKSRFMVVYGIGINNKRREKLFEHFRAK